MLLAFQMFTSRIQPLKQGHSKLRSLSVINQLDNDLCYQWSNIWWKQLKINFAHVTKWNRSLWEINTTYFVWLNIDLFSKKLVISEFCQNAAFEALNLWRISECQVTNWKTLALQKSIWNFKSVGTLVTAQDSRVTMPWIGEAWMRIFSAVA